MDYVYLNIYRKELLLHDYTLRLIYLYFRKHPKNLMFYYQIFLDYWYKVAFRSFNLIQLNLRNLIISSYKNKIWLNIKMFNTKIEEFID